MTSLNPVLTIGFQIAEALRQHRRLDRRSARAAAITLLEQVGLADAARRYESYPNQISGGMCQRAMIAMALACHPRLLIADEPTTALDVTIQAQILALIRRLRDEIGMAVILVTHNLGVVAEIADRVAVMYAGQIVETAAAARFFAAPLHPYAQGLMDSMPRLDRRLDRLQAIRGNIRPVRPGDTGCHFRERCSRAMPVCASTPPMTDRDGTSVACWLYATP
jgi:peptide/nickel transport system ATP-binding protein